MFIQTLHVLAVALCGLVTIPAAAHVLELPGKMRLTEAEYRVVQRIYYPGFTLVGTAEVAAPIVTLVLLLQLPPSIAEFWLVLFSLVVLLAVQAVFWLVTQPVNRQWVSDVELSAAGSRFFDAGRGPVAPAGGFIRLRNRWEYSHVARAALSVVGLVSLAIAA